ncbi:torsin-1A-interacting protein 1-like [Diadema antillarum]|uniref:torsin-1A-interacting protein 1-like n=1 Tax=Diadema antillarum TaxID=105358 RepID=UPI003A841F15
MPSSPRLNHERYNLRKRSSRPNYDETTATENDAKNSGSETDSSEHDNTRYGRHTPPGADTPSGMDTLPGADTTLTTISGATDEDGNETVSDSLSKASRRRGITRTLEKDDCEEEKSASPAMHRSNRNDTMEESKGKYEHQPLPDNKQNHVKQRNCVGYFVLTFLLLIVLVIILKVYFFDSHDFHDAGANTADISTEISTVPMSERWERLKLELESLEQSHSDIDSNFWDLIVGPSWSHVRGVKSPIRPVVLMLVAQSNSLKLSRVSSAIASLFSRVFSTNEESIVEILGSDYFSKESGQAKLAMDTKLRTDFDKGKKVALIQDFDKLPACSILLFHSYCDNEYAPYKDAVLIFTVQLNFTLPLDAGQKLVEESLQEHLAQVWSQCPEELSSDKIMAMHSRVSNNIVFIK